MQKIKEAVFAQNQGVSEDSSICIFEVQKANT